LALAVAVVKGFEPRAGTADLSQGVADKGVRVLRELILCRMCWNRVFQFKTRLGELEPLSEAVSPQRVASRQGKTQRGSSANSDRRRLVRRHVILQART
jgi:hypothetical protein